jgi:RNA polymerase sigma factor (sigma-70 family)
MSRASANDAWDHWKAAAACARWLSYAQERELIALAQAGDRAAVQRLCASHLRLVLQIARQYQRSGVHVDDLVSEGWLGLIEAVSRFDLTQTTRLSTYAAWWIRARVRGHVFRYRNVVTPPSTVAARIVRSRMIQAERTLAQRLGRAPTAAEVADELGTDEDEVWDASASYKPAHSLGDDTSGPAWEPPDAGPTPEEQVSRRELQTLQRRRVTVALATLGERDRKIVSAHFSSEDITLANLGTTLGVSRQRVSQIVKRVCKQLERDLHGIAAESAL